MENICLGIELGSTRIKAVAIDEHHALVSSRDYTLASTNENGVWTCPLGAELMALLNGLLSPGIPFAPAEDETGTDMTATNVMSSRIGNISADIFVFSMVVLEKMRSSL